MPTQYNITFILYHKCIGFVIFYILFTIYFSLKKNKILLFSVPIYRIPRFNEIYRIHDNVRSPCVYQAKTNRRCRNTVKKKKKKKEKRVPALSKIYAQAPYESSQLSQIKPPLRKLDRVDSFWPFPFSDSSRLPFNACVKGELTKNRLMDRILWCLYLAAWPLWNHRQNDTVHPHLRHSHYLAAALFVRI